MTERWKCPDCGGWVAETVPVHKCSVTSATGSWDWAGFWCSMCGTFVVSGTVHMCSGSGTDRYKAGYTIGAA